MNALILQFAQYYWSSNSDSAAAITNTGVTVFDDAELSNSAEVEQTTELENECTDFAICTNLLELKLKQLLLRLPILA